MDRVRILALSSLVLLQLQAQAPPAPHDAAQEDLGGELEALLNTPITVASSRATSIRESPGVVTLITRQEILNAGARDLIDVLRMVPGMDFASDVQGVVGLVMRGSWGNEGKILLVWDGQEMNETLYGCLDFGNHYPVDQIKQIEIIRGPGSSIYGGYAELGVIKVTTLSADDLKGSAGVSVMDGAGSAGTFHQQLSVVAGGGEAVKFSFAGFTGRGVRSAQDFTDSTGATDSLKAGSSLKPLFVNLGVEWSGLSLRVISDHYRTDQQDFLGTNTQRPYALNFLSDAVDLRYRWKVADTLVVTPSYAYKTQYPWQTADSQVDPLGGNEYFNIRTLREKAGVNVAWDPRPDLSFLFGLERIQDDAHNLSELYGGTFLTTGTTQVSYTTNAALGQLQWSAPWANLTLGARWENNSYSGSSFVPRVALTRMAGLWHFKLLYAQAYKPPTIENINTNFDPATPIAPEKTRTVELEVGRQLGSALLTVNLFDTQIRQPIVYFVNEDQQGYANFDHSGSQGLEVAYKLKRTWGYLDATQSFSRARNDVPRYTVPGHPDDAVGIANAKTTLGAGVTLAQGWTLAPTVVYYGRRYGMDYLPALGAEGFRTFDPVTLLNLNLSARFGPLNASLGVFNLLGQQDIFIQGYASGHSPLPGPGREFVAKVRYGF